MGSLFGSNVSVVDYINGLPMAVIFTKDTVLWASSVALSYFGDSGKALIGSTLFRLYAIGTTQWRGFIGTYY